MNFCWTLSSLLEYFRQKKTALVSLELICNETLLQTYPRNMLNVVQNDILIYNVYIWVRFGIFWGREKEALPMCQQVLVFIIQYLFLLVS